MNKDGDERVVPQGEYLHAENVRVNSSEGGEMGIVENSIGNEMLVSLEYNGQELSDNAVTIGAVSYPSEETLYWLIHDPTNPNSNTSKVDMIVSYNVRESQLQYHVVSVDDGTGSGNTTLNFNPLYLVTGINIIDDLIFWTDNNEPPRKINRNRFYPLPVANIDRVRAEELTVIVAPPIQAPVVSLVDLPIEVNYIEEVFASFSYRWRYKDNEYSATSQYTAVAFQPGPFSLDRTTYLNDGMINRYNGVEIQFDTGTEDVIGVDLCYKLSDDNQIWVLEKYNKDLQGWGNNETQSITFSKSKLYTALPVSEILRRFDNVPLKSQAQTTMGNRLIYGNYYDGNSLTDIEGRNIDVSFSTEVISNDIGVFNIPTQYDTGKVYLDPAQATGYDVTNNVLLMNLEGIELLKGSAISISVNIGHEGWTGASSEIPANSEQAVFRFEIIYNLKKDFASPNALATNDDFISQIGSFATQIQTVADCLLGVTATDRFNCAIVAIDNWTQVDSGVLGPNTGFNIISSPTSDTIGLQIPAMKSENDIVPGQFVYEYFKYTNNQVIFTLLADQRSLHSNWDYEVGIEYIDENSRATTVLTCPQNTVHIPTASSVFANNIRVSIPPSMRPPSWAVKYRFLVRPSKEGYETIYSDKYYRNEEDDTVWIKLEGESQNKVVVGQRFIVKSDSEGAQDNYVNVAVLNKEFQSRDFIPDNENEDGDLIEEEDGVYMQMRPNQFSVNTPLYPVVGGYSKRNEIKKDENDTPYVQYPLFEKDENGDPEWLWDIPSGSIVTIYIKFRRADRSKRKDICGAEQCILEQRVIATNDYSNFQDFWESEGIDVTLANCEVEDEDDSGPNTNVMIAPVDVATDPNDSIREYYVQDQNMYQFKTDSSDPLKLWLSVRSGTVACGGVANRASKLVVNIKVERSDNVLVFETEPLDSVPDLFYEGSECFDIVDGNHIGNISSQTENGSENAVSDLNFFNCYSFGNGVESYKILDSLSGRSFKMGERVSSVTAEDFKLAHRYADLTYSGVYNEETNVNKLNEFNGGLANFKTLEKSYGFVMKLHGRETDILCLQEDKISYVQQGKNLLVDSTGGGVVTSVPEILGTQIARPEEYGISMNPESFVSYGYDKFFTDSKRGSVLMLSGVGTSEQLSVISDMKMKSYFRDLFIDNFNTQKLGGFDPYMREYVLSTNDKQLPASQVCIPCGRQQSISINKGDDISFCVELGTPVGDIVLDYEISTEYSITFAYDFGSETFFETVEGTGSFVIPKTSSSTDKVFIGIIGSEEGDSVFNVKVGCPLSNIMTVVPVAVTSEIESGSTITDSFVWSLGAFTSVTNSQQVLFVGDDYPIVSDYRTISGQMGQGVIPTSGASVLMIASQSGDDNRAFDPTSDRLRYLFSDTAYDNNAGDISDLLSNPALTEVPVIVDPNDASRYFGNFAMQDGFSYLYLVWDYRKIYEQVLCYINKYDDTICCDCVASETYTPFASTNVQLPGILYPAENACEAIPSQLILYHDGDGAYPTLGDNVFLDASGTLFPLAGWLGLVNNYAIEISGGAVITETNCQLE